MDESINIPLVHNLLQARHSEKDDMISSMDKIQVIDYVSLVLMLNLMYIKLYDSKFKFCHILWRNKPIPEVAVSEQITKLLAPLYLTLPGLHPAIITNY